MERRHEVTRLEGFSDATFGFALTLLVVSLDVAPKDTAALLNNMKSFLPIGLMFAMICWIWYEHQRFFRNYGLQDAWTVAVNCVLLFVVLFYVYPMKFLTQALIGPFLRMNTAERGPVAMQDGETVMLLYSAGVVLIFGTFVLLYRHAWNKREELALSEAERLTLTFTKRGHIYSTGLGVLSIVIVLIGKRLQIEMASFYAGILYALMGPIHGMNGYQAGKAHELLRKRAAAQR